jgi:tripartite-type tricarboxylate transporter receptor subunit TctC
MKSFSYIRSCIAVRTAGLLVALVVGATAHAQNFSDRPIHIVVPYTAGTVTDIGARILAEAIAPGLGTNVIVDNKPGASGQIAANFVARSKPDGYTLLYAGTPQLIMLPIVDKKLSYKPLDDFKIAARTTEYDLALWTGGNSGVASLQDLNAKMRDPSAKVDYATVGVGPSTNIGLAAMILAKMANGRAEEISYQGGSAAMIDLMAGRVTFMFAALAGNESNLKEGRLRALAVATPERIKTLPNVPTFAEGGLPEFTSMTWSSWSALAVPAKTPDPVVEKINRVVAEAYRSPALLRKLEVSSLHSVAGQNVAEANKTWRDEYERLAKIVDQYKIKMPD